MDTIINSLNKYINIIKIIFLVLISLSLISCEKYDDTVKNIGLYNIEDIKFICDSFVLNYYTYGKGNDLEIKDYISNQNLIKYIEYKYQYESNIVFQNITTNLSRMEWFENKYVIVDIQAIITNSSNSETSESHSFLIEINENEIKILDWFVLGSICCFDDKFRNIPLDSEGLNTIQIQNGVSIENKDFWDNEEKVKELFLKIENIK